MKNKTRLDPISGKPMTKEQLACPTGMMVNICSDCGRFKRYVPAAHVESTGCFSHGLCESCCHKRIEELEAK